MDRATDTFGERFSALTGFAPFRWQRRLFGRLAEGRVPGSLDLPTGLGKTSVMAIWLLARAEGAKLPRRLVYVVDRHAVVDQATAEAEKLRKNLGKRPDLKTKLGLGAEGNLPISTLRGQYVDNREWLADPAAPAIVVGTVDMIGSRLLFEGYGVSRRMRPYHAGLLGVDTLVVLDEAHLVPPFEALLRRMAGGRKEFGPSPDDVGETAPPFRLLSLSATGRERSAADGGSDDAAFRLEDEDLQDPDVEKRLAAKKTLRFAEVGDAKDALVDALAERAWEIGAGGDRPLRTLVYCDSRDVAEKVKDRLDDFARSKEKGAEAKADTELFVGARRVREREEAKAWLQARGFLAGSASPAKPAFLVATSAGEVGIDLDADHMVCDLVPWERMVQRLGRVNRRGDGDAAVVVVHGGKPKPKKADEPTEQEKRAVVGFGALAVLGQLADGGGGKDASPGALRELKQRAEKDERLRRQIAEATTPEPLHPALTRPLVDAWSMTSLETHTGRPDVAPWLRGWVEEERQTSVLWRRYLPIRRSVPGWPVTTGDKEEVEAFFEAAPPQQSELLETETYRVVTWLQDRAKAVLKHSPKASNQDTGDENAAVEAISVDDEDAIEAEGSAPENGKLRHGDVVAFVLSSDGDYVTRYRLVDLARPRDNNARREIERALSERMLIVDGRLSGLRHDGMLDADCDALPDTVDVNSEWSVAEKFRVCRISADIEGEASIEREDEEGWHFEADFDLRRDKDGNAKEKLVILHFRDAARKEDARSIARPQELAEHQSWVESKARAIAAKIGLAGEAAAALSLAALLHDEGKRAERWQRAFRAPFEKDEHGARKVFAKTLGPINQAILDGYRHEFGSLPYVEANAKVKELTEPWRDLVLHLVAAHHGQARPVIEARSCEDAPPSALETRARDVALRFVRLQQRWGPWGLAWWEALLRAADQQASRDNDEGKDPILADAEKT